MSAGGSSSVNKAEIAQFDALAARWWDPSGPMRPLHAMNPVRAGWILQRIDRQFGTRDVRLLDVGCGAGLLSETLAKAGCDVLGLDAGAEVIAAAQAHAAGQGLRLAYEAGAAEDLHHSRHKYDVITTLEVIEHVEYPGAFVRTLSQLLAPGGLLFISTLNRTAASYATAKLGAEYLLRLLPVGTHDWNKFVTPQELAALTAAAGLRLADIAGMSFAMRGGFKITRDTSSNYIAMARSADGDGGK
jgi:2-polyprenyl-6-hydroxyphenyl methylase/3-demethylubiquinone-9 3-methyltransferase